MLDKMNFITDLDLKIDEENWINSLKKTQWGSGYQIPNWLEIYKKSFNSIPLFISVKNQNSEIVGQLACIIHEEYNWNDASSFSKLIGTKLKLKSVLTWAYGPIIHDTKNQQEIINSILTKIEEIIKKYNITMVRGFTSPDSELKTEIFDKFDYTLQNWSTYSLNLKTDPETILSNLNKKIRYDIKKAEEKEFVFEIVSTKSIFDEFSHFAVKTKIQHGEVRNWNKNFFNNLWELGYKNGSYKVFLVKKNNEILSALDLLIFNKNAIQIGVVNSPKKEYHAGTFLTWNVIKWATNEKLNSFDFGGANPHPETQKEKQIDFYKSKWNNEKMQYFFITKITNKSKTRASSVLKKLVS